jgi:hypothetical protein
VSRHFEAQRLDDASDIEIAGKSLANRIAKAVTQEMRAPSIPKGENSQDTGPLLLEIQELKKKVAEKVNHVEAKTVPSVDTGKVEEALAAEQGKLKAAQEEMEALKKQSQEEITQLKTQVEAAKLAPSAATSGTTVPSPSVPVSTDPHWNPLVVTKSGPHYKLVVRRPLSTTLPATWASHPVPNLFCF